jgi:hypothetical protein
MIDLHNAITSYTDSDPAIQASIRSIKLVGSDNGYEPLVGDMTGNSSLLDSIYAIGTHYTGFSPYAPALSLQTGNDKRVWISEEGPLDYRPTIWQGAQGYAQMLNRYYVGAHNTSVQMVSALAGYYDTLDGNFPNPSNGMLYVNRPWSGYYNVLPAVWVMGHVGQFTQGPSADGTYRWRYIDSTSCTGNDPTIGSVCADGSAPPGTFTGSYTTFRQISSTGWTAVIETTGASGSQSFTFCPTGGLATPISVNVWDSNLNDGATDTQYFVKTTVSQTGGCYAKTLSANHIYTLTTLTGGTRVVQSPPTDRPLAFADIDGTFENRSTGVPYQLGETPKYFSDLEGAFQIGCGAPTGESLCLSQVDTRPTILWGSWINGANENSSHPLTVVGEYGGPSNPPGSWSDQSTWWCNYSASVGVRINGNQWAGPPTNGAAGFAGLLVDDAPQTWGGFELRISTDSTLELIGNGTVVAGPVGIPSASGWHIIKMSISGDTINTYVDDQFVFAYTDPSVTQNSCGFAGLTTGWNAADFDLFNVHAGA